MRILSITAQKPDSTGSGVYLSELVKEFYKMGHEQAVIAGIYHDDRPSFPPGTKFCPVYFKSEELPFAIAGMSDEMPYESTRYCDMTEEMTARFKAAFLKAAERAVEEFKPDLILCHHLYLVTSVIRERFPDRKIFGFCHNTDLRQMQKTDLMREYIKEQIHKLDRVFVPQKAQRQGVLDIYGMDPDKVFELGMGYNSQIFRVMEEYKAEDSVIRIVFAGKIAKKKGVASLLNSLLLLPYNSDELEVKLAGGAGNEQEYQAIRELAKQVPCRVDFLGRLSQPELAKVYNACDIFVLPSFFDGLPLTVIEALACGDRVVITDLPGIRDWLNDTAPGAPVSYVRMPKMRNTDEPIPESLPAFEQELADRIAECIRDIGPCGSVKKKRIPDLSRLSWENICERILETS